MLTLNNSTDEDEVPQNKHFEAMTKKSANPFNIYNNDDRTVYVVHADSSSL